MKYAHVYTCSDKAIIFGSPPYGNLVMVNPNSLYETLINDGDVPCEIRYYSHGIEYKKEIFKSLKFSDLKVGDKFNFIGENLQKNCIKILFSGLNNHKGWLNCNNYDVFPEDYIKDLPVEKIS